MKIFNLNEFISSLEYNILRITPNITNSKDHIQVRIKLPGYDLKDIHTKLNKMMLTICGKKESESKNLNITCQTMELSYQVKKNSKIEMKNDILIINFRTSFSVIGMA